MRRSDLAFFLSGAAALVYQVAWARLLSRLTGSDTVGVALVLAVFMAGMGLGAWGLAGVVARVREPRRAYFALAVAMAVWAAASPWVLGALDPIASLGGRVAVAVAFLAVPTALMGASFPLMGRLTIAEDAAAGAETSRFYGANTIGAAGGAVFGAFVVFPALGLDLGLIAGAALDLAAGVLVLGLPAASAVATPGAATAETSTPEAAPPEPHRTSARPLLATFLLGAASLALEVLLTRALVNVTGASVYAFALVLAVFLLGLGVGGRQALTLVDTPEKAARTLRRCFLWIPAATVLGVLALSWQTGEADVFGPVANRMPGGVGTGVLWASTVLFAGLALFPPAVGFGLALPACVTLALARRVGGSHREGVLGRVYAANTAGATLGSLVAAFVLLPSMHAGLATPLVLGVLVVAAPFAAPLAVRERRHWSDFAAWFVVFVVGFGTFRTRPVGQDDDLGRAERRILSHEVGRDSTVTVESVPDSGGEDRIRALRVNGKVVATTAPVDLRLQRVLGIVPGLLAREPESAVVIGLGTGMTAGSLLGFPSLESLRVVEISAAVVRGAREFAAWNAEVVDDGRTTIEIADGRHALAISEGRFDVVTADPIHPWTRGSSDLYALEHFRRMREHLAPGGVASQWLPLYQLSREDVLTVVATWCAAFENTSAWLTAYDLVLVGAAADTGVDAAALPAELPVEVARALAESGIRSSLELAALQVADDAALRALAEGVEPMRERHPVLEFRAPLSYLAGYSTEILRWAAESPTAALPEGARERGREVRALLDRFLEDLPGGLSKAADAYGDALLDLEPLDGTPAGR